MGVADLLNRAWVGPPPEGHFTLLQPSSLEDAALRVRASLQLIEEFCKRILQAGWDPVAHRRHTGALARVRVRTPTR